MLLAGTCDGDSFTGFHFFFVFQPSDVLAFIVQLHTEDGCIIYEDRSLPWKFFNDVPFKKKIITISKQHILKSLTTADHTDYNRTSQQLSPNQNIVDTMQASLNEFLGSELYRTDNPKDSFWPSKTEKQPCLTTVTHVSSLKCKVCLWVNTRCGGLPRADLTVIWLSLPACSGNTNKNFAKVGQF